MTMKLSVCGLALTLGILWAVSFLFVGMINRFEPRYAPLFLETIQGLYPGYIAGYGLKNLSIGVIWAFIDGAVGGALLAWIYNRFTCCISKSENKET